MSLAELAAKYFDENDDAALAELASRSWPALDADLPYGVGEVCRFASIRAAQRDAVDLQLWRARALTAAVIQSARETAAGLLLPAFFAATRMTMDGAQVLNGPGHAQARAILEEMKRLVPEGSPAWSRLFARLYHEKRGLSYLMEAGSGEADALNTGGLLDLAEVEYRAALDISRGDRGRLKVRGGLALVRYLGAARRAKEEYETRQTCLAETQDIRGTARAAGYNDVDGWAARNAEVMDRGALTGWVPYEVL